MPRQARIDAEDCFYHVMARGIERREIFYDDDDRRDFVRRLSDIINPRETKLYAWALMPNHFHLFLQRREVPLARIMRRLMTGYATAFNRRHRRTGHLFANRYKSILCEKDPYFLELIRYVHLNPLRAGIVRDLGELRRYPWSGYAVLMGEQNNTFQAAVEVLKNFGINQEEARGSLEIFMKGGLQESDDGGLKLGVPPSRDHRILGSAVFAEEILKAVPQPEVDTGGDRIKAEVSQVLTTVAAVCRLKKEVILSSSRERSVSKARALLCVLTRDFCGKPNVELQKLLGLSSGAVSQLASRGRGMAKEIAFICKQLRN